MSDETFTPCSNPHCACQKFAEPHRATPPTPDPRERGECECNESGFAQSECIRNGCRAPAPARPVGAEFSVCVWCDARVEWTASADRAEAEARLREHSATCPAHPAVIALRALRAPEPSEAVATDVGLCATCRTRRAGVRAEGDAEGVCYECYIAALERIVLHYGSTHPAPARGVTVTEAVVAMADEHAHRWRDKDESYWLSRLMQEVGELASALVGDHPDPVEHELRQVASIAINWLRRRALTPDAEGGA